MAFIKSVYLVYLYLTICQTQLSNVFDSVREVFSNENIYQRDFKLEKAYDFIIVGAGSAGCVLANRLSENPNWTILLLEAGGVENYFTDIPLLAPFQSSTAYNWNFGSEKSPNSCRSLKNNSCSLPRGKALGGTSVINFLVYTRGSKSDFNNWENSGNKGWSYNDVLPYFKKSENCSRTVESDEQFRGDNGPLYVQYSPFHTPLRDVFLKTGVSFGYRNTDPNGKYNIGFSKVQATMTNGKRCSAAKAYLRPIRKRPNLFIVTEAMVTKILIENKIVSGVEFMKSGSTHQVQSKKETIVSAGSINTPQLLMLSGIGPREDLERFNIPVIANLRVGYNLQDHCSTVYTFLINETVTISDLGVQNPLHILNYWLNSKGPLTLPGGAEALAFIKTKVNKDIGNIPDIELILGAGGFNNDLIGSLRNVFSFPNKLFFDIYGPVLLLPAFSISTVLLKPKSRGRIRLRDDNPLSKPIIDLNYFEDESDVNVLVEGFKIAKMVGESKYFKKYNSTLYDFTIPACKHWQKVSDKHTACLIRNLATTLGHQVGTCKMGPSHDPNAVVDSELKVYGIKRLRVIDGSVIPDIIAGHPNSVIIMIAEKASDLIKTAWQPK